MIDVVIDNQTAVVVFLCLNDRDRAILTVMLLEIKLKSM